MPRVPCPWCGSENCNGSCRVHAFSTAIGLVSMIAAEIVATADAIRLLRQLNIAVGPDPIQQVTEIADEVAELVQLGGLS